MGNEKTLGAQKLDGLLRKSGFGRKNIGQQRGNRAEHALYSRASGAFFAAISLSWTLLFAAIRLILLAKSKYSTFQQQGFLGVFFNLPIISK